MVQLLEEEVLVHQQKIAHLQFQPQLLHLRSILQVEDLDFEVLEQRNDAVLIDLVDELHEPHLALIVVTVIDGPDDIVPQVENRANVVDFQEIQLLTAIGRNGLDPGLVVSRLELVGFREGIQHLSQKFLQIDVELAIENRRGQKDEFGKGRDGHFDCAPF